MNTIQQLPEEVHSGQRPVQPTVPKRRLQPHESTRRLLLTLVCLLLLGGIFTGIAAAFGWSTLPLFSGYSQPSISRQIPLPQQTSGPEPSPSLIKGAVQGFMNAMLHKHWTTMWSLLHPNAQQFWQGEQDFMHFEQEKFGALQLSAYTTSAISIRTHWRDLDTTLLYSQAALVEVSLQAAAPQGLLTDPSAFALRHGLFNQTLLALAPHNGTWRILLAGPADADAPILVPRAAPMVKILVPIFMYHHVSHLPTSNPLDYSLTVTTSDFEEQLIWLQQHGYQSITQTELFDALYDGKALPAHPMMLTFDDGYEDVYTDALPALLAHQYRGVFYIITGKIGGAYMTWDQIRTLAQDGMQISSHTVHHVNVGNPPAGTSTHIELASSQHTLETLLDEPIQFFCYPSGEPFHHDTVLQQQNVLKELLQDGYVGATLDPFSLFTAIQNAQTPYLLNRLRVSGGEDLNSFVGILEVALRNGRQALTN